MVRCPLPLPPPPLDLRFLLAESFNPESLIGNSGLLCQVSTCLPNPLPPRPTVVVSVPEPIRPPSEPRDRTLFNFRSILKRRPSCMPNPRPFASPSKLFSSSMVFPSRHSLFPSTTPLSLSFSLSPRLLDALAQNWKSAYDQTNALFC